MARVSRQFVNETLWPEFEELSRLLRAHLSEVTDRVIAQAISPEGHDEEVRSENAIESAQQRQHLLPSA